MDACMVLGGMSPLVGWLVFVRKEGGDPAFLGLSVSWRLAKTGCGCGEKLLTSFLPRLLDESDCGGVKWSSSTAATSYSSGRQREVVELAVVTFSCDFSLVLVT